LTWNAKSAAILNHLLRQSGTFSNTPSERCLPCPLGRYTNFSATGICSACPRNTKSEFPTGSTACEACKISEYQVLIQNSDTRHFFAHIGLPQPNLGQTACFTCPPNQYPKIQGSDGAFIGCFDCPPGVQCTKSDNPTFQAGYWISKRYSFFRCVVSACFLNLWLYFRFV
jgi:hypothetical protein